MTISSQSRKAGPFTGNGSTTAFPFAFKVFQASDVYVVRANTAGVESVLTSGTDYTVTLNANQNSNPGGTVTLTSALATNFKLVITSAVPNLQPVDITNNGGFYPKVINDALDRVTIMVQQTAQEASRGIKLPITSSLTSDQFTEQLFDARDEAVASASAASTSASSAASSAASASGSATTATTKASEASTSASGAASSASAAAGSATAAAGSATTAGNSATTATNKANEAASSATAAASSATAAAGSATTATTKAGEATTAAAAAAGSQTAAASSASSAGTSATNANNSATSASNSATSAASSASAASSSATSASTSASTATTKASEASTSATNAATSATNAASSATSASASATSATNSAAAAATSETNAASSASSAAASAAAAATALDNFDDRYLGPKSSNPTVDNDGNALVTGALYYRTTAPIGMKVWDGAQWLEASAAQQASLVTYEYVATAGQTTFSGADANGVTLSYTVGNALVSVNGVRLRPGDDFTATNGTSVVLVAAAAAGDEVLIDAFRTFEVANTYTQAQVDAALALKQNSLGFTPVNKAGDTMTGNTRIQIAPVSGFTPSAGYDVLVLENGTLGAGVVLQLVSNPTNGLSEVAFSDTARNAGQITYKHSIDELEIRTNALSSVLLDAGGRMMLPRQTSFYAYSTQATTFNNSTPAKVVFNNIYANRGGNYSASTGRFTAPVGGFYQFNSQLLVAKNAATRIDIILYKNGNAQDNSEFSVLSSTSGNRSVNGSWCLELAAGDYVEIYGQVVFDNGSLYVAAGHLFNKFSGFLVG